jgi:hypothetical protein
MPNAPVHHEVTLNYGSPFSANPPTIKVKPADTISFRLGQGPANGKIRVTFKASDQGRFSTRVFNGGDPNVRVTGAVVKTTYHCELLVNGAVVAESQENGGEIEPATGT